MGKVYNDAARQIDRTFIALSGASDLFTGRQSCGGRDILTIMSKSSDWQLAPVLRASQSEAEETF